MQDDWARLLPIAEFADNDAVSNATGMTPFFANTGFHPRMYFSPPLPEQGVSAWERTQTAESNSIADLMVNVLE